MIRNNLVIDLSHHNIITDFDMIINSGVLGIIHKATEGTTFVDKKYANRKVAWLNRDGLWGAYHFIKRDGETEAKHFLDVVNPDKQTLLALDYEVNIDKSECEKFVKVIFDETGRYPLFYINNAMLNTDNFSDSILTNCPLWVARYGGKSPNIPAQWNDYTLWQYSAGGRVTGMNGNVDIDTFNGDVPALYKLWNTEYKNNN